MRKMCIYITVIVTLLLAGCGNAVATDIETKETVTEGESEDTEEDETTDAETQADTIEQTAEQTAEEAEQNEENKTIKFSFEFLFDPNVSDPGRSVIEDVSVMTFAKQGINSNAKHLAGSRLNSWTMSELSVDHEKVILSEKGINDIRRININLYNENFSDDQDFITEAYAEASKVFAAGEDASDGFPMDYTEKSPTELNMTIDGNTLFIPVVSCNLDERGYIAEIDDSGNPMAILDTICIEFICETDDIPMIKDCYSRIAEECKGNTEELEPSSVAINDAIVFDAPEEILEAQSEKDLNTASDTGIFGKWYPVEGSDFSEYYIQIDQGGTGAIHRGGEVIPFTYSYSGDVISVVISIGGTNEFYYENGELTSDFDGSVYRKK